MKISIDFLCKMCYIISMGVKKGARFVVAWFDPYVVRISWGGKEYDYYLDGVFQYNKYCQIRRYSENKAALWVKKRAWKEEKVGRVSKKPIKPYWPDAEQLNLFKKPQSKSA